MTDQIMHIDRRELLGRALLLLGASGAAGFSPAALAQAVKRSKPNLDPAAFALLTAVADTIIPRTDTPGAVDAGVPAKLDVMLTSWASPARRTQLSTALADIDAKAKAERGKGFAALPPAQRKELLLAHDSASLKPAARGSRPPGLSFMPDDARVVSPEYAKLKELILVLYYYSEQALTTELVYEHSPGGWTPSVKVTPETRATGGMGMF